MLDFFNRYMHGYFALPIMQSCFKNAAFTLLKHKNFSLQSLSENFKISNRQSQVILDLFKLDNNVPVFQNLPGEITELYQIPSQSLLKKSIDNQVLQNWLEFISNNNNGMPLLVRDCIEGAVILPLLIALKKNLNKKSLVGLPNELRKLITNLFISKGWAETKKGNLILMESGRSLLECAYEMRTCILYAPLLCNTYSYFLNPEQSHYQSDVEKTLKVIQYSINYVKTYIYKENAYSLHYAKKEEALSLLQLEEKCWPSHLVVSPQAIIHRIEQFPSGQLVLKNGNHITASVYTQKIKNLDEVQISSFNDIPKLHTSSGNIIRLLGISVDPDFQDKGLGDQLMAFILWWAAALSDVEKVIGVTRCQNYKNYSQLSMKEYVKKHQDTPIGIDPILRFHTSRGAKIRNIIPHYRPEDIDNRGTGILIEYSLFEKEVLDIINCKTDGFIAEKVKKCMREIHLKREITSYEMNVPLMEMGFDSLRLLELRVALNREFGVDLDAIFFLNIIQLQKLLLTLKNVNQPKRQ